jgi:hypothetical protein
VAYLRCPGIPETCRISYLLAIFVERLRGYVTTLTLSLPVRGHMSCIRMMLSPFIPFYLLLNNTNCLFILFCFLGFIWPWPRFVAKLRAGLLSSPRRQIRY